MSGPLGKRGVFEKSSPYSLRADVPFAHRRRCHLLYFGGTAGRRDHHPHESVNIGTLTLLEVILDTLIPAHLKLAPLSARQLITALGLAAVSVFWYELVKLVADGCVKRGRLERM